MKRLTEMDVHVGRRIRMRRMMLGLSQSEIAEPLGITFQQVQKIEKGQNRIGAGRLQHVASILKVPVGFFFEGVSQADVFGSTGAPRTAPPDFVQEFCSTRDGLELAAAFQRITDPTTRRKIVALVEAIAPEETRADQRKTG